jgi:RHS repeat-associated protein
MASFSTLCARLLCGAGLLLAGRPLVSQAQTTLRPGDILVTGVNSAGTSEFSFVTLVDLAGTTRLTFTDNGWQSGAGLLTGEGSFTYTVPAGSSVRRGTVINYRSGQRGNFSAITGTFQLATGGDQLLVYQGTAAQPSFVGAIGINSAWTNGTSAATSALPPGLVNGASALTVPWDNAYESQASHRRGGVNTIRNWFTSVANWTGSSTRLTWSTTTPFSQSLTISPDVAASTGLLPVRLGSGLTRIQHLGFDHAALSQPVRDQPLYDAASPDNQLCLSGQPPADVKQVLLKVRFDANSVVTPAPGEPAVAVHNMGNNTFTGKVMLLLATDAGTAFDPITLQIDNATPERSYVLDMSDFFRQQVLPGTATKLLVDVRSYAPGATTYANNFRLSVDLEEAYYFTPQAVDPAPLDYARTDGLLEQTLSWQASCLTQDYQLQLFKLKASEVSNPGLAALLGQEATWRTRATTLDIQTTGSSWQTTLGEGYGTYYYRLRALAPAPGGATNPENWGPWSAAGRIDLSAATIGNGVPSLANSNWIYQRTFTEGGRVSEKMTFANGLLQQRQVLMRMASTQQLIGLQTLQDYVGRNAVQSLPIPVPGGDAAFTYKPGLLTSLAAGAPQYSTADFDADTRLYAPGQARETGYYTSQPVYGSASPASGEPALNEGVPDAGQYPFARTLFTTDGTNRVREQGGAGPVLGLRASQPHTTRTYYSGVVQDELTKLMGREAPLADKMSKTIVVDPNGTASVSYQTQEGKTIATALAGAGSPNTTKLPSATNAADQVQEKVSEKVDFNGIGSISRKILVMTAPAVPITITYSITPATFTNDCTPAACTTCDYQVTISAYRLDATSTPEQVYTSSGPLLANCSANGTALITRTFTTGDPGTYVIEKKVTAYNTASGATSSYLDDAVASIQASYAASQEWQDINAFLAVQQPDLNGLYAYLGAKYPTQTDASGQEFFMVPFGCNSDEEVKIPKLLCPECSATSPGFEQLFATRWPTGSLAAAMPSFPYSGPGDFDAMITAMLADPNYAGHCQELKDCWAGQVEAYETLQLASSSLNGGPPVDLAQSFLDCAATLLTPPTNCAGGGTTCPTTPVKSVGLAAATPANFYKYARYDAPPAATNAMCLQCLQAAILANPGTLPGEPTTAPANDGTAQGMLSHLSEAQATAYARCRRAGIAPPSSTPANATALNQQAAEQLSVQMQANCEDRRSEFRQNVIQQAAADNLTLSDCDIEMLTDELVQQCKLDATLTSADFMDAPGSTTTPPLQIMTQAASERFYMLQLGQVQVGIRPVLGGSCPSGYTTCPAALTATDGRRTVRPSKAAYELISYANELIKTGNRLNATPRGTQPLGCPANNEGVGEQVMSSLSYTGRLTAAGQQRELLYGPDVQPDDVPGREHYWAVVNWQTTMGQRIDGGPTLAYFGLYFPANVFDTSNPSARASAPAASAQRNTLPVPTYTVSHLCLPYGEEASGIPKLPVVGNPATYVPATNFTLVASVNSAGESTLEGNKPIDTSLIASLSAPYSKNELFDIDNAATPSRQGIYVRVFYKDGHSVEATIGWEHADDDPDYERVVWREVNPCSGAPRNFGACLKWTLTNPNVFEPDPSFHMPDPAPSCQQVVGRQLLATIQEQQQKFLAARLQAYRSSYASTCAPPEKLNDQLTLRYELGYHHYTLYYYDRGGNLMKTVPPAGVHPLDLSGPHPDYPTHQMVTTYDYNSLGQMVRQHTPDGGTTSFYYNKAGQLRFSLNDKQRSRASQRYSFTQYDVLGRVVRVGESTDKYSVQPVTLPDGSPVAELRGPLVDLESLNDPDPTKTSNVTTTVYTTPSPTLAGGLTQHYLNNRVSYVVADAHSEDTAPTAGPTITTYSYDPHGNVEWLVQDLPGLGAKLVRYDYDLISNKVLQVAYQPGEPDQFYHRYQYDDDNRLTAVETSPDGVIWEQDAQYRYYAHGPLRRTTLGDDRVQGLDYTYTLQGWLKAINHPMLNTGQDPGHDGATSGTAADAFGMVLGYYRGDYQRTGSYLNTGTGTPGPVLHEPAASKELFNGNIATWTSRLGQLPGQPATPAVAERYRYDQLNRLLGSSQSLFNTSQQRWDDNKKYLTTYTYDANGNLATLSRHDEQAAVMDSLDYHYANPGESNQLDHVTDHITDTSVSPEDIDSQNDNNYSYDEVGNLIADAQSGISKIAWTPSGKIARIANGVSSNLTYRYDGLGNRISKVVQFPGRSGLDDLTTYYVRDASGNIMAVYELRTPKAVGTIPLLSLVEQPLYGSARLGERKPHLLLTGRPTGSTVPYYGRELGLKYYELSDHLGNVRAVLSDQLTSALDAGTGLPLAASLAPVLSSYASYYPFGQLQPGRYGPANPTGSGVASAYRFGFNGKEKDNNGELGLTSYDYGFRIYNPGLGRFLSVDPLAKAFPTLSAYQFAGDNPIAAIDLDGLEPATINPNTKTLVIVLQGYSQDPEDGKTQALPIAPGAPAGLFDLDTNGLGKIAVAAKGVAQIQVVTFSSSTSENTKEDVKLTLHRFAQSTQGTGQVVIVGHSQGADNAVELLNENPQFKADLLILLDIKDASGLGTLSIDDNFITSNVKNVINYYQTAELIGGEKVFVENACKTSKANILAPGSTHRSIDNDVTPYIIQDINNLRSGKNPVQEALKRSLPTFIPGPNSGPIIGSGTKGNSTGTKGTYTNPKGTASPGRD